MCCWHHFKTHEVKTDRIERNKQIHNHCQRCSYPSVHHSQNKKLFHGKFKPGCLQNQRHQTSLANRYSVQKQGDTVKIYLWNTITLRFYEYQQPCSITPTSYPKGVDCWVFLWRPCKEDPQKSIIRGDLPIKRLGLVVCESQLLLAVRASC